MDENSSCVHASCRALVLIKKLFLVHNPNSLRRVFEFEKTVPMLAEIRNRSLAENLSTSTVRTSNILVSYLKFEAHSSFYMISKWQTTSTVP